MSTPLSVLPQNLPELATTKEKETIYFAYGSNLSLSQMAARCPESKYLGLGRLENYRWQINQRGYANVVPAPGRYVDGLCYLLSPADEESLDVSEGVPTAYEKIYHDVELYCAHRALLRQEVSEIVGSDLHYQNCKSEGEFYDVEIVSALVYENRRKVIDGIPEEEYVDRLRRGAGDAKILGIEEEYFELNMEPYLGQVDAVSD
ncbi:hypothetical protein EDC01DRAFT_232158 [Geopyxis carbonaria]|nr:hypothetical protein EDC01DRAFT_232158 [Geopyxis carbonaria]